MVKHSRSLFGFSSNRLVRPALRRDRGNLGGRVIHGVAWQFAFSGFRVLLTVISTAILARLLTPKDYGLVAMTTLVVEVAGLVSNLGFGAILIQKKHLTRLDLDTTFWASLGIGGALVLFIVLAAYPAAVFFDQPSIVGLLCVSALSFIFQQMMVVPSAILSRLLMFRTEVFLQIFQLTSRTVFAIGLAWFGAEYWSLVIAPLLAVMLSSLTSLAVVGYLPRYRFNRQFIVQNWRASGSYLGSGIVHYLLSNFDYLVVGRRFGPEQLGYYQTAYSLPDELRNRLSGPLQKVLFPAYALLQDDLPKFRQAVTRSQKMLAAIVLPMGAGLAIVSEHLVPVLYGEKWLPVVPLLQILAIGGALRALFSLVASIYYATGRPDLAFKISLISAPFVLLAIYAGSNWGAAGVASAMVLVSLSSFVSAHIAMRLIGASLVHFLQAVLPAVLATLAMLAVILTGRQLPPYPTEAVFRLIAEVVVGALAYPIFLRIIDYQLVQYFLDAIKKVLGET